MANWQSFFKAAMSTEIASGAAEFVVTTATAAKNFDMGLTAGALAGLYAKRLWDQVSGAPIKEGVEAGHTTGTVMQVAGTLLLNAYGLDLRTSIIISTLILASMTGIASAVTQDENPQHQQQARLAPH